MSGIMFFGMSELERKLPDPDKSRADSPDSGGGGYFTLSDSDLGADSPQEEEITKSNTLYKMFRISNGQFRSKSNDNGVGSEKKSSLRSRSETPSRLSSNDTHKRSSPPKDIPKKSTPPRPNPPKSSMKVKSQKCEEDAPPRPPPPISYTSTLPPPVPKKIGKVNSKYNSKTLPARRVNAPKQKPLQKVAPLQMQSPSMLEALRKTPCADIIHGHSSSDECVLSSLDTQDLEFTQDLNRSKPSFESYQTPPSPSVDQQTFLTTFQKAQKHKPVNSLEQIGEPTAKLDLSPKNLPTIPKKKSPPRNAQRTPIVKTARSLSITEEKIKSPPLSSVEKNRRSNSLGVVSKRETLNSKQSANELSQKKSVAVARSSSSSSDSSKKSSPSTSSYLRKTPKENRKTVPQVQKPIKVASESLAQRAKSSSEERINKFRKNLTKSNSGSDDRFKRKSSTASESDRDSIRSARVSRSSSISSEASVKSKSPVKSKSVPPSSSKSTTKITKPEAAKLEGKPKKLFPRNPIQNLIKFYESSDKPQKTDHLEVKSSNGDSKHPVVLEDKYNKVLFHRGSSPTPSLASWSPSVESSVFSTDSTSLSPSLGRLSLLSQERQLEAWLSSPLQSIVHTSDMSLTEIDILDQCITDLIINTQDIKPPTSLQHEKSLFNPEDLVTILDYHKRRSSNDDLKSSLQTVIDFVEAKQTDLKTNSPINQTPKPSSIKENKSKAKFEEQQIKIKHEPTEDDLKHGCFTDVSFAGTFASAQPEETFKHGCFTEVSFAGTFAQKSLESVQATQSVENSHTLIEPSAVTVNKVKVKTLERDHVKPQFSGKNTEEIKIKSRKSKEDCSIQNTAETLHSSENSDLVQSPEDIPCPSPRVKKRARKEHLLQQHKLFGKHVLDRITQEKDTEDFKAKSHDAITGLDDLLNDLVDHSESIKRNVNERQSCTSAEISEPRLSNQNICDQNEIQVKTENVKNSGLKNNKKVFLRTGVLSRLEEEREEKLGEQIIRLQAVARGHIARKKLQKLKTQDIAIRCIQKNVEKFMGVRDWAWWRLLVKVSPLLNVQRTEERLKQREDEVEQLKQRLEKVERERKEFKDEAERNQARLSEMTADLTEEQNASTIATERLETEQAERMKLEREKADLISRNKTLNSNAERYELELMHSRALDINGLEDGEGGVYRVKYERAVKDMDHIKKMMAQQHEDDLEQLGMLKKQLEKKLNDAYEEVDEQRQVGAQWKRKTQKIQGEMNDLRLLLEEQTSRNSLLEKKQRKFDAELAMVQEDRRQDQLAKEKVQKDLEHLRQEKNRMEDTMKGMKIDLESRDEKISALNREISDIQMGGATEDEVRSLKKTKKDLEMQLKDQEEELDDLAAQVQMLEGSKTKIEMEMAALKKEHRREMTNRDEEIEEARASASKKVKILEQQLEQEHEERIMFLRERHELEQKIGTLQDMLERSGDEEQVAKLKKDLRKTKALLRDAQLLVEKTQNEGTNKVILRQLKNQLEDAEFARTAAMKARQNAELELADTQLQLEDVSRAKQDLEEKHLRVSREKAEFASQLQENEEELQDVMRKYKASVAAVSTDQITIQDQQSTIQELEEERNKLRDAVAELSSKLGNLEGENVSTAQHKRLELKIRELESKLELELTSRSRLETQIVRLKETIEKITKEKDEARLREQQSSEQIKKHSRQIREMKEDYVTVQGKEIELSQKKNDLEKQLEVAEAETLTVRSDLKLALKRIEDLQAALAGEMDSDNSDDNSDSSDDEMHSFMEHHRRAMSVQRERESMARESIVRESMARDSSILRESVTREVRSNGTRTFASIDESRESISMDASKLSSTIAEIDESQA